MRLLVRSVGALVLVSATVPSAATYASAPSATGYDLEELSDLSFSEPRGLILDAAGNAYTFEHLTGAVFEIAAGSSTLEPFANIGPETWVGIAYDASIGTQGTLYFDKYVAGEIVAVDIATKAVTTAATGLVSEGTGGIASNGAGRLFVTTWAGISSNCPADVLKIDLTQSPPVTTTYVSQQVCYPDGPAVADDGTVYVAERGGRLIRRIDATTQDTTEFVTDFVFPLNVSVAPSGDLLVPDAGDGRSYRVDPTATPPQKVEIGTGFGEVYTAVEDADGRIWVASMDLGAIYRLTPQGGDLCAQVTCTPSDPCHVAGTCDPMTGQCSNPNAANGTSCNDSNACTQTDTCQAGVCSGANPVTCTAKDECHVAGTCDPTTGQCSNPNAVNGTSCNDGDACTQTDTCQAGVCSGANPVTCTAKDECHDAGACDAHTGQCDNVAKPDGSPCTGGMCQAGICATPALCGDGTVSAGEECDDGNGENKDGCDRACHVERGWNCEGAPSTCSPTCGDGIIVAGEEACDDGNQVSGDGCSVSCRVDDLWTCAGEPSECARERPLLSSGCATGEGALPWLAALPLLWGLSRQARRRR